MALVSIITEVAATANVDLLVQDDRKDILLAWRVDPFGVGWHVPGSIIRRKEEIAHRIAACAADELGCPVAAGDRPIALVQIFDDRGHSVSICYLATLKGEPAKRVLTADQLPEAGDLCWFQTPPAQLYPSHLVYRELLEALDQGGLGAGIRVFTQHVGRRDAGQTSSGGAISSGPPLL